jgi:hypothetical protein
MPTKWMTAPSVITPRSANKPKKAKQLNGTASASNKSRFMAKWSVSGFAAQPNSSPPRRSDNAVQKFNDRNRRPMSNHAKPERRHDYLTSTAACASFDAASGAARRAPMHSDLKVSAAAVDDESCQDNEKHNCGGDRPPVIFAPPWAGPPAVAAAGRATSIFNVWVYHFSCPR